MSIFQITSKKQKWLTGLLPSSSAFYVFKMGIREIWVGRKTVNEEKKRGMA